MTVHIDWSRVETVCGRLLAASDNRAYPYQELWALPQTFIPQVIKEDSRVHACFLFCVCHYMRGTIKSDHAVKQLVRLWKKHPEYFDPEYVREHVGLDTLEEALGSVIAYKKKEMAFFWKDNLTRLAEEWGSDPRNLFAGNMTSALMYERIRGRKLTKREQELTGTERIGFWGFQKKMASMLAYFLMDAGLVAPFTASPPVDFHLIRVMLATGMLAPQGRENGSDYRYEHLESLGVKVLETYARKHQVNMVTLGNALWMLSVVICSMAPGTRSTAVARGADGKKVYPVPVPVDWNRTSDVALYLTSCARCPVEELCSFNVYAGPYYQQGALLYLPRERNPHVEVGMLGVLPAQLNPKRHRTRVVAEEGSLSTEPEHTQPRLAGF